MKRLSVDNVLLIHAALVDEFGGSHGVRDAGLLDSALNSPFQTFDGEPLFPDVLQRGAKLAHGLISNHPFVDGNKRVGVTVMALYLQFEGYELQASNEELVEFGLAVATRSEFDEVYAWVRAHTVKSS